MKKERAPFQATTLRSALIVAVVVAFIASAAIFYLGYGWLKSYADEVNVVVKQAGASGLVVESPDTAENPLVGQEDLIVKANAMFAPANNFQSIAITDIQVYATNNRISIGDISMSAAPDTADPNTPTPSANTLTVTFESAPSYRDLLTFIAQIQNSTPKMQVSGVNITRINDGEGDDVTIQSINVEVATR